MVVPVDFLEGYGGGVWGSAMRCENMRNTPSSPEDARYKVEVEQMCNK